MPQIKRIVQTIIIDAPADMVMQQAVLWGQSEWWPQDSLMRIEKISSFKGVGTRYLQKVKLPNGPRWHTKTSIIEDGYIKRVFLNGMFYRGFEEINIYPQSGSVRLEYAFCFERINGKLNRLLWNAIFLRLHKKHVDKALLALKKYLEGKL